MTRRLGIPDQTGGRSGKPDGTLQLLLVGVTLPVHPFFVLELSELLAGSQTCGQALVSPEGRRAKGKRTFRVPIGPSARSAWEDTSFHLDGIAR